MCPSIRKIIHRIGRTGWPKKWRRLFTLMNGEEVAALTIEISSAKNSRLKLRTSLSHGSVRTGVSHRRATRDRRRRSHRGYSYGRSVDANAAPARTGINFPAGLAKANNWSH
jgi:hypothetical protein